MLFVFPLNDQTLLDNAKEFAIDIINTMEIDDGSSVSGTRVAIITMDNTINVRTTLDANIRSNPKEALINIINNIQATNQQANNINEALNRAYNQIFVPNGDRASARNLMILLADLVSAQDPRAAAQRLREDKDVTIFPIQVTDANNPQLEQQLQSVRSTFVCVRMSKGVCVFMGIH